MRRPAVLGLITARGGSRGLPGKNVLPLAGKPLIAWTIEAARAAARVDRVVLSTDDPTIADVARSHGCDVPFQRPQDLATDTAGSIDVVLHALDALPGHGVIVLLQPTSPLRAPADIDATLAPVLDGSAPACVSVTEAEQPPHWMYSLDAGRRLRPLLPKTGATRRQDLPATYVLNGAVYAADASWLRGTRSFVTAETVAHVMPPERSVDIDTALDLAFAELLLGAQASSTVKSSGP